MGVHGALFFPPSKSRIATGLRLSIEVSAFISLIRDALLQLNLRIGLFFYALRSTDDTVRSLFSGAPRSRRLIGWRVFRARVFPASSVRRFISFS